jgi:hypothetical protein
MPMIEPEYGFEVIHKADHIEVQYKRESGGSGRVFIFADRISVDGDEYAKRHIGDIFVKVPKFIEKEIGHVPPPPSNIFASLGQLLGALVKASQMKRSDREDWSVWFTYGEKKYPLAYGVGQVRAAALEDTFSDLILRGS